MIFLLFTVLYLIILLKINLLKEPSTEMILLALHATTETHLFNSENPKNIINVCNVLNFLDNIYIRTGTKLYRQVVGSPLGTNCAPLVTDLYLFCYEGFFMMSLSDDKQADIIDAFNTTSRYMEYILNV